MPWRAFGGSDQALRPGPGSSVPGFNALAGVRGFGLDGEEYRVAWDTTEFQCPGGRSGVRTGWFFVLEAYEDRMFQCPGGRSGVRTSLSCFSPRRCAVAFQCPGGRSGVRTGMIRTACHETLRVEFQCPGGRSGVRTSLTAGSPAWTNRLEFQCPGGRSGVRTHSGGHRKMAKEQISFNALAGVRGFGLAARTTAAAAAAMRFNALAEGWTQHKMGASGWR